MVINIFYIYNTMGCKRLDTDVCNFLKVIHPQKRDYDEKKCVNYYPFGLQHKGYNDVTTGNVNSVASKFKYNGIELEESLGLNLYEMELRLYDPAIARWNSIDPVTHFEYSTYSAFDNNPIYWADPSGANSKSFLMDIFNRSSNDETWTNDGSGVFVSDTGQTAQCDDCPKFRGGDFNGKSFNEIQEIDIQNFGFREKVSKKHFTPSEFSGSISGYIASFIDLLEQSMELKTRTAIILGVSEGKVINILKNLAKGKLPKVDYKKLISLTTIVQYTVGLSFYIDAQKDKQSIQLLGEIVNSLYSTGNTEGVFVVKTTTINGVWPAVGRQTRTNFYDASNQDHLGTIVN